ncbi:six-hairpin glycosidase-like protein [Maribacter sp. ANRC-HE7]|uniref:Six-hairpin glycosidase-like protein n=1 Tax=Maribacter aquimaris TaxID=2737171 RepID=A0ABR7V2T4_9FLAO|nr:six-hairpin glycosidase-like protein [Maribacter aquimaris]MBD0778645.1 six-hairpin glycosidase-like protein [Maribacter aquimaris]
MMVIKNILVISALLVSQWQIAQEKHWSINKSDEIRLDVTQSNNHPYQDNMELSGKRVSGIVTYAINDKREVAVSREIFFPQLRTFLKTNDPDWKAYRAYLKETYSDEILPSIALGDRIYVPGPVSEVSINGMLTLKHEAVDGVALTRTFFPSMSQRLFVEQWTLTNTGTSSIVLKGGRKETKSMTEGAKGNYAIYIDSNIKDEVTLLPGKSYTFSIGISATMNDEERIQISGNEFYKERLSFLDQMKNSLELVTPDPTLNTLFGFSKIRASESIFESKLGLIHSPGGGRYYVGFWANDQAEYVGPFFPYLGYATGNEASLNVYRIFDKETNDSYTNLPYSFEMEGDAPKSTLDRGDAAMIAYGATQFALASGDKNIAKELWPLITWCLEYNRRQLNDSGVVVSKSDEMEGRIPTGTANLSTSSLYYGALGLAVSLGRSLNENSKTLQTYSRQAKTLKKAIESYFGATIEGIETYKYYKEHTKLRHWICLPLVVGIYDRKEGTTKALFDKLWSENGVHVEKNDENKAISEIFWDRGTLYALRGTFLAGSTEESLEKLDEFSNKRLLGDRVPYVVEAFPEGNMAQLSAESGLYCRVFTEGVFGIVPTGLHSFKSTPRLPKEWDHMALKKIKAFGENFDISIVRKAKKLHVKVVDGGNKTIYEKYIREGDTVHVHFK